MVGVSKRASIGGCSNGNAFSVGLHTDQQSLILGEMMTARNKLQEENQILRDKLQDANMMIRLLHLTLAENNIEFDIGKETGFALEEIPMHRTNKCNRKTADKVIPQSLVTKKNAFRNQVAPGRKTFESKAVAASINLSRTSSSGSVSKLNVLQHPKSPTRSKSGSIGNMIQLQKTLSSSPDSRQAEPEEHQQQVLSSTRTTTRNSSSQSTATTTISTILSQTRENRRKKKALVGKGSTSDVRSNNGVAHHHTCFGEEQFPGSAQQMRSVVGKLAQVVINEYSTTEDDDNEDIIFE